MSTRAQRHDSATCALLDRAFYGHGTAIRGAARWLDGSGVGHPVALLAAFVQTESGGENVFGHDPTIFRGAGPVTRATYEAYKRARGPRGEGGMQGVGLPQLTWWEFQDRADELGGCWLPEHQMRVAAEIIRGLVRRYGLRTGIARYNGSGAAATRYSVLVLARYAAWWARIRLTLARTR